MNKRIIFVFQSGLIKLMRGRGRYMSRKCHISHMRFLFNCAVATLVSSGMRIIMSLMVMTTMQQSGLMEYKRVLEESLELRRGLQLN